MGAALEVFLAFLGLGLTSFGGPVAHLGYFRTAFVERRRWIDGAAFADLVALCQVLPGPLSSQLGFALGLRRAGALGGLAAWVGFTLPSAVVMAALGLGLGLGGLSQVLVPGLGHGLKLATVAVVAAAVFTMARSLITDLRRAAILVIALIPALLPGGAVGQVLALFVGGLLGLWLCRGQGALSATPEAPEVPGASRRSGAGLLALCAALLLLLPLAAWLTGAQALALADVFARAGALVFGGGHVVLPLLQAEVMGRGWLASDTFLAGYGAAQLMPGPLFSFAAFVGAAAGPEPHGLAGAAIALCALFLPGLLLVAGALPFWEGLRRLPRAKAALAGANAAVVGVLALALWDPVWTGAVHALPDGILAVAGFAALAFLRVPPVLLVLALMLSGLV